MKKTLIPFTELPWNEIAPGAREKRMAQDHHILRLLEFSPPFNEPVWCVKGHRGYVVDGAFSIQFRDCLIEFSRGDGLLIPAGEAHAHRALVDRLVTLFLVETTDVEDNHVATMP